MVVQWLRFHTCNAGGVGLILCCGTKILHVMWPGQKKTKNLKRGETIVVVGVKRNNSKEAIG